jgi:hypothetical protein
VEVGTDQALRVGAGAVGAPQQLAVVRVQRRQPATHAELAAAVADQNLSLHHQGSHGDALPLVDVAQARLPRLLSGRRVDGDGVGVQRVEDELPVVQRGPAVHHVTAGHPLCRR